MRLYAKIVKIVFVLFFTPFQAWAQYVTWEDAFGRTSEYELKSGSKKNIHELSIDSIIKGIQNKRIIILGDQRHSVWESFAIKNYIIQNVCLKEKINYLHEGSIYEFYYNDCKEIFLKEGAKGFLKFKDVYFGKSLGYDLLDSLSTHGITDSIKIGGIDYLTRNITELTYLYKDLSQDMILNTYAANEAKIDTGFVRRMIDIEIVNHEAIENTAYNDSAKVNLSRIISFYSNLIAQKGGIAEKFKKKMWQCVGQSMRYYLEQKNMDLRKAQDFDMQELTKSGFVLRDRFLYENIKWFLTEVLDSTIKTFISIASIHTIKSMEFYDKPANINPEYKSAGMLMNLDKSFTNRIYALSIEPLSGYSGMFENYLSRIPSFLKKNYESKILNFPRNIIFYDLQKSENQTEIYLRPFSGKFVTKQKWNKFFDAIIFVKDVIPNAF